MRCSTHLHIAANAEAACNCHAAAANVPVDGCTLSKGAAAWRQSGTTSESLILPHCRQFSALQHPHCGHVGCFQHCRHGALQGVSSGDPFAKSVILWTRVTVPQANKPAFLDYCVSKDRKFRKCVTRGTSLTNKDVDFTAKVRHCKSLQNSKIAHMSPPLDLIRKRTLLTTLLQVEARGLKPNTVFYYQWRYRKNDRAEPVRALPTQKYFLTSSPPDA
jgi:PhoD-like phosphatase, N-terminal domain